MLPKLKLYIHFYISYKIKIDKKIYIVHAALNIFE